jgi:hypothetical protein
MNGKPKLTIGMAHHSDYDGVYFTIQAIRAYHPAREVELIVVDNSPDNEHGKGVENLVKHWANGKYIPMREATGTTQPRERIFAEATAPAVLCLDCHVLLIKGAVQALIDHYAANPETKDIISGPMFYDDGRNLTTHFNEEWRSEMFGTWGLAWTCPCGKRRFSAIDAAGRAQWLTLSSPQIPYPPATSTTPSPTGCVCGRACLPDNLPWPGHEAALIKAGYRPLAVSGQEPFSVAPGDPFEIPGCGLGCFSMRKAAWPGFNPHFREFGGEEIYIHTKVRQHGGRAICLPALGWVHRFARVAGVKYPLTRYAKVRNYVLGFQELGLDLGPIHEHFIASGLLPPDQWAFLLADPVNHVAMGRSNAPATPAVLTASSCGQPLRPLPPETATLQDIFEYLKATPRDLDQHLDKLSELAAGAGHVTELAKRRESTFALLHANPKKLVSYQREAGDPLLARAPQLAGATVYEARPPDPFGLPDIERTDVLFLDDVHTADRLWSQLDEYGCLVRRRIIIRGTGAFGEKAEGMDAPGLLVALRRFLRANPEWSVIYHTGNQYGLTVISRDRADKPKLPGVVTLAANLAAAVATHVVDGVAKVQPAELEDRLQVCTLCDQRRDDRCSVCGCFISVKATWRTSECPLGRWPAPRAAAPESAAKAA